jgi:hypothetical protein
LKFYSVALIGFNVAPWLVSYPIPALSVNFLNEFFFLKFLIINKKQANTLKYDYLKKNWIRYLFFIKIKYK